MNDDNGSDSIQDGISSYDHTNTYLFSIILW